MTENGQDIKSLIVIALNRRAEEREHTKVKQRETREKAARKLKGIAWARAWALEHFNANMPAEKNTLLDPPSFIVLFEGDEMTVEPQTYGTGIGIQVKYRFIDGPMGDYWSGGNPLTGFPLPPLWVTGDFY